MVVILLIEDVRFLDFPDSLSIAGFRLTDKIKPSRTGLEFHLKGDSLHTCNHLTDY